MNKAISRTSTSRSQKRGSQALASMKPFFRREVVESKVKTLFPLHAVLDIFQILNEYQSDSDELSSRVQLDALKLCGGNLEALRDNIRIANREFRDVIMSAENPRIVALGIRAWAVLPEDEKDRISCEDLKEYLVWVRQE
jgi:hypothetical protein